MKIALCGNTFPRAKGVLATLLPDAELATVEASRLEEELRTADVVIPMMARIDARIVAGTSARLIQQWGAGLEGVDVTVWIGSARRRT